MPPPGAYVAYGLLAVVGAWFWALATGRVSVGRVRDERDALLSRWFLGAMGVVLAVGFAVGVDDLGVRVLAGPVAVAGVAVIVTARRRAPHDQTTAIPRAVIVERIRAVRPGSGSVRGSRVEIFPRIGWTIFMALGGIGAEFIAVLGSLDVALDPERTALDKIMFVLLVGGILSVLIVIPTAWWVRRVIQRVPFVTIDDWGIVMGRDRHREASIAWDEIASIEVRAITGGYVADEVILVHPIDPKSWYARQRRGGKILARVSRVLYRAPFVLSTAFLTLTADEILARIALHKPSLIDR